LNNAVAMMAHTLTIALFLAQGCAPAALVASAVRGDPHTAIVTSAVRSNPDRGDLCTNADCGLDGGGTASDSVWLPIGIIAAFATPVLLHYLIL
jgi:hypothetical protein